MSVNKAKNRRSDSSDSSSSSSSSSDNDNKERKRRSDHENNSSKHEIKKSRKHSEERHERRGRRSSSPDLNSREHHRSKGTKREQDDSETEYRKKQTRNRRDNDNRHGRSHGDDKYGRSDNREYNERRHDRRDDENFRDRNRFNDRHRNAGRDGRNNRRNRSRSRSFDHANAKWGREDSNKTKDNKTKEKQKPNFGLSGKLTEETNTYKGVVIKYSEPPEARKPKRRWRLYPFKGEKALQTLYIHRESAYLIGRERKVVDLAVDHPSCSKQHAALQYRLVPFTRDDGSMGKRVRPYLIDLESANGTFINNKKIEPKKYVELLERDVIKFGFSSREYVLLHENSKDEAQDDDVKAEEEEVAIKKEEKD